MNPLSTDSPVLPPGYRLRLTARRHAGGLWESTLRPAIARIKLPAHQLPRGTEFVVTDPASAAQARRLMHLDLAVSDPDVSAAPSPPSLDNLTVVIPIRGRPGQLNRLLELLTTPELSEGAAQGLKIIVVNDATDDPADVAELIQVTQHYGVHRIDLPVNLGPGGARNAGLAEVRTDFVAFLDSDIVFTRPQLSRLLAEFTDPLLALAAPRMVGTALEHPTWTSRHEQLLGSLDLGPTPGLVGPQRRITYMPSACWVCRTEAVAGGFEPSLRVGEDVDLVWRLHDSGWQLRYVPEVQAGHDARPDLPGWWRQHRGYGLSSAPLRQRHGSRIIPARYTPTGIAVAVSMAAPLPFFLTTTACAWALSELRLRHKLAPSAQPSLRGPAARLAWAGVTANVQQTAQLVTRYWLPVLAPLALSRLPGAKTARRVILTSLVCDSLLTVRRTRSEESAQPPRSLAEVATRAGSLLTRAAQLLPLRAVENTAFSWGVVVGSVQQRTLGPLLPELLKTTASPSASRPHQKGNR